MNAALQRLRAEIKSDVGAFEQRLGEMRGVDLDRPSNAELALVAVALHHAYSAIESALSRVARAIEGSLPTGADWHQALLEAMALEIPGVRPAVISQSSLGLLRRLLGFRHFFRHAYAVDLDRDQLSELRSKAEALREPLLLDLDRLDRFLDVVSRVG
jgi:hypothetical protein